MHYLNHIGARKDSFANIRSSPSIYAPTVGRLTALGGLAEKIEEEENWTKFNFNNIQGWVRNDVFHGVNLGYSLGVDLDISYVSQNDNDSRLFPNDCGPASLLMLMKYEGLEKVTVNEVSKRAGLQGRSFSSFANLMNAAEQYGFKTIFKRPFHISEIIEKLNQDIPVLALVYYHQLIPNKHYGHFLVVKGYELEDENLYITVDDPNLFSGMIYPVDQFAKALAQVGTNHNMPFQVLYIEN